MRVICKDSDNLIEGPDVLNVKLLTVDKIYEVLNIEGDGEDKLYEIEDNSGYQRWYRSKRFIDLALIRNDKLNQLGI